MPIFSTVLSDKPCMGKRDNNFDGIRLILASMVIYTHSFDLTGNSAHEGVALLTQGQASAGGIAVTAFFALSGYLVFQSLERSKTFVQFFWKRFIRVYPALIAAVVGSWIIAGPLGGASLSQLFTSAPSVVKVLFGGGAPQLSGFCEAGFEPRNLNGSLWTIRFEIACYVGLAVLGAVGMLRGKVRVVALLAACFVANLLNGQFHVLPDLMGGMLNLFVPFLAGAAVYAFNDWILASRWVGVGAVGLVCASIVSGRFWFVAPVLLAPIVVAAGYSRLVPLRSINRIGDFSYGLYVYAFPVQQVIAQALTPDRNVAFHFAASMLLTGAVAVPSWFLLEKPLLRFKARVQSTSALAAPVPS